MDDSIKDKIDNYWLNRLSSADRAALEAQMNADPTLKQEVMAQQKIINGINAFGESQLKKRLQSIHQEVVTPTARVVSFSYRKWAAAAAILLLCVCAAIFFFLPANNDQLFADHYEPYAYTTGQRSQADDPQLLALQDAYRQGDYTTVLNVVDDLPNRADAPLQLVKGIAALETTNWSLAESAFRDVVEQNDPLYVDHGRWYLALTYLQQDQIEAAKASLLPLVQDPASDHHAEAKELYEAL